MANFIKNIWTRIKIDWFEYWGFKTSIWNIKRDNKAIDRAIETAQLKNSRDGRSYYVLRNLAGGFDPVSSADLNFLKRNKIVRFPKYRNYVHMRSQSFATITSDKTIRESYTVAMHKIQNDELNELKNTP